MQELKPSGNIYIYEPSLVHLTFLPYRNPNGEVECKKHTGVKKYARERMADLPSLNAE